MSEITTDQPQTLAKDSFSWLKLLRLVKLTRKGKRYSSHDTLGYVASSKLCRVSLNRQLGLKSQCGIRKKLGIPREANVTNIVQKRRNHV